MNESAAVVTPVQLKRISIKEIVGTLATPDKETELCIIYGLVSNFKIKATDSGQQVIFQGDFEALNLNPGAQLTIDDSAPPARGKYISNLCVLPPNAEKQLLTKVWDAQKSDDKARVEFAYEISIFPRNNALGYEVVYTVISPPTVQELDPLVKVRTAVDAYQPVTP